MSYKNNLLSKIVGVILIFAAFTSIVYANSSWYWISELRPFDILPWVVLGTILVEWLIIYLVPKTGQCAKVLGLVIIANTASFLLPYLFLKMSNSWYGTFERILDSGPHYIVSGVYLVLTIVIEFPIMYEGLKKNVEDTKLLNKTILVANIITSIGVAVVERLITEGSW
ncbi:MAG: hypothetical protein IKE52_06455 [Mogibacterium sp.]|nr:hypothetical protein [Mogibacterium sp.]